MQSILASTTTKTTSQLPLSPSIQVTWPKELALEVQPLPSLNGFLLTSSASEQTKVFISRQLPPRLADPYTVKRFWKKSQATAQLKANSKDSGCTKKNPYLYVCERVGKNNLGEFLMDRMVWSGRTDLVFLHATSKVSIADAKGILEKFQTNPNLKGKTK